MAKIMQILFVTSCVIIAAVNADVNDMSIGDIMDYFKPIIGDCKTQRSYYEELFRYNENPSHDAKCFRLCFLKEFNLITEDDKMIDENVVAMAARLYPNKEKELNEIAQICKTPPAGVTDMCDITHVVFMCMMRESRARGLPIPEFKD